MHFPPRSPVLLHFPPMVSFSADLVARPDWRRRAGRAARWTPNAAAGLQRRGPRTPPRARGTAQGRARACAVARPARPATGAPSGRGERRRLGVVARRLWWSSLSGGCQDGVVYVGRPSVANRRLQRSRARRRSSPAQRDEPRRDKSDSDWGVARSVQRRT